eukprot:4364408-Pyramimonas_sp.AAC.1
MLPRLCSMSLLSVANASLTPGPRAMKPPPMAGQAFPPMGPGPPFSDGHWLSSNSSHPGTQGRP